MNAMHARGKRSIANPFKGMRNIGPATRADLTVLGITSIEQLATSDPDQLFISLQIKTAQRHDPCVWDVFAARAQTSAGAWQISR